MSAYTLRLSEDRLEAGARHALPPLNRVLYVIAGDIGVTSGGSGAQVGTDAAWHGSGECAVAAGTGDARILRYELLRGLSGSARPGGPAGVAVKPLLEHPIDLDASEKYLMRCDRVDFAPGGEALPHGHRGGGIRCLLAGELEVRVGGNPGRLMKPGDAWFESGVEPVHAVASKEAPTSFIRVSILPHAIRGMSSIVYVNPAHASVKPRKYTVYVDEPIEIP